MTSEEAEQEAARQRAAEPSYYVRDKYWISSVPVVPIKKSINANFVPKEDVTAYELAILLPFLLGAVLYQDMFDSLPVAVTRHLIPR